MTLRLQAIALPADASALIAWLAGDRWPFHGSPTPTPDEVRGRIEAGAFASEETQTFWLHHDLHPRVGLLSVQDVTDLTPVFDLRLATPWRGRGLAGRALELLARHAFLQLGKSRVEGHTRVDNVGMRRAFLKQGWVKEAHYRQAWPGEGGRLFDAITYALLRVDWERGTQTPVPWRDEPASTRGREGPLTRG